MQRPMLSDQVVVIVGATSGIGRETARRMASRSARLVVTARDAGTLGDLAQELSAYGAAGVETVPGDIADPSHSQEIVDRALTRFGRIDTWVHVAGVEIFATFEDTEPDEFRRLTEVNLLGPAYAAKAALPALERSAGAFIAVSSVAADVPVPFQSAYAASKHGLDALLRSIRMELEQDGSPVTITQVQPYGIDTPLFGVALTRLDGPPRPAAPTYGPEVVAELIVHAAEHPSRELFAGGFGWLSAMTMRYAPRLGEAVIGRLAARMQTGDASEHPAAPGSGNLFTSAGSTSIRGGYGGRSFSVANRLQMLPSTARIGLLSLLILLLGTARRARRSRVGS
jgi:short-subunit dehydrogenase